MLRRQNSAQKSYLGLATSSPTHKDRPESGEPRNRTYHERNLAHHDILSPVQWLTALGLCALVLAITGLSTFAAQEGKQEPESQENQNAYPRERNGSSDWATDNQEMVSASATQIREVLIKDPGLMMELKRVMAKQATDRGQIVAEQDLEDSVILDRLDTDPRFRALATRLLQRYGYLTPEFNPTSPQAEEQQMLLKARAEQLARAETGQQSPLPSSTLATGRVQQKPVCPGEANDNSGNTRSALETAAAGNGSFQPGPCSTPMPVQGNPYPAGSPQVPMQPNYEETPPVFPLTPERPDLSSSPFLTASAVSSSGSLDLDKQLGPHMAPDITGGTGNQAGGFYGGGMGSLQSGSGYFPYGASGIPVSPMEYPQPQAYNSVPTRREIKPPAPLPEPVRMVNAPNPYAFLPSLYDLYVQAAPRTGPLQRFGLDAFRSMPASTGIPMDLPAGPDYIIGPGDGLTIDLWGGVSQRLYRTVDREGRVALPEAGPLLVSGRSLGDVQEVVQRVLRTQYRDVSADVSLTRLRTVRIYVVGEVVSPGAYDISTLSTPLNALWAAGGVTARGSLRLLRHMRGSQLVEQVDVYDLLLRGIRGNLKGFENGDTLLVPSVGPQVSVDGMVRRPAIYELRDETNLAHVVDLAGGVLPAAALRHIEVQRLEAHEKRSMLSLNIDDAGDPESVGRQLAGFQVRDGDEVHIFPIAPYNSATVYLQGHVLRPGRYAYTPGMTVANLLTSYRDLLPEPASHYAEIIRLRQPDWRPVVENFDLAAALEHPSSAPKLDPLDTVRIFGRYDVEAAPAVWLFGEVREPGQYRTTGQMHLRDAIYQAGGLQPDAALDSVQLFRTQSDGSLTILNVNLAAALAADPLENVLVQPRDRIIVHRSLYRVDPPSVYIKGEVASPGRYPLAENMTLSDLLAAAGGPKRSADLKDGDLTRYSTVSGATAGEHQRVDLTGISRDPALNIRLRDGDVLSVPQLPRWNDLGASVAVKGEVKNPGVYGIRPGERLSSVIKRAGGLLPTAFPQGIIFTRVSVREFQEKSRQDLMQRLQQETPVVKAAITTTGAEEAALQGEALQQRDRALEALRRAPVTGRLVVRMLPGMKGFETSAEDIELLNGDSIEIPKPPGFVLVVGQVYNTNAVTYVPGKNVAWYLSQGGGVTRLGDRNAIFLVRANGEVVSRRGGEWWSGTVLSAAVRPGDTIVVPERPITGGAGWKNLLAIAQFAEAGAITAAVIP